MKTPPHADAVQKIIVERIKALDSLSGIQETVTVEWRGQPRNIPVISMQLDILHYNPDTHRLRAQRSTNPSLEQELRVNPYGAAAQDYLHQLLMGDPMDPTKTDTDFTALKDDLSDHGQSEPGIITPSGVLINGNTRRAALRELGEPNIRVGVLPPDTSYDDILSVELSLQLRKDHKRDYSFMNLLLAIEDRAATGQLAAKIQADFRIKATTYEQRRWILGFVMETIDRSRVTRGDKSTSALRLVDFESHQGKLEELYRAYTALKAKAPDKAEALKEQRLLALALDKSKTDLRLIEPDFVHRYMKGALSSIEPKNTTALKIPGTSISVPGPSPEAQALSQLTTDILRAKAVTLAREGATVEEIAKANEFIGKIDESMVKALDHAGKQGRVIKRRLAPVDRISDACDDLELAISSVAEARSTRNFEPTELDEILLTLRSNLEKLSAIVTRSCDSDSEGIAWIRSVGQLNRLKG